MTKAQRAAMSARMSLVWTPEKRADLSAKLTRLHAERGPGWRIRGDHWRREECDWLKEHAGEWPVEELTARYNAEFATARTVDAVKTAAKSPKVNVSLWMRGLTMRDLARIFGAAPHTIRLRWVGAGLLPERRWDGRGASRGWWFMESDVERFIEEHVYAYDWRRMAPGPWRRLGETAARADPWIEWLDACRMLGFTGRTPSADTWRKRGVIPYERRHNRGASGRIMVRARLIRSIRTEIEDERSARSAYRSIS